MGQTEIHKWPQNIKEASIGLNRIIFYQQLQTLVIHGSSVNDIGIQCGRVSRVSYSHCAEFILEPGIIDSKGIIQTVVEKLSFCSQLQLTSFFRLKPGIQLASSRDQDVSTYRGLIPFIVRKINGQLFS